VSAIILLCRPSVVHIATDGLTFGVGIANPYLYLSDKIYTNVHLPLILANRGHSAADQMYMGMFSYAFDDFDDLVARLETVFPALHAKFMESIGPCDEARNAQLMLGGWSRARQRCEAYFIRGGDDELPSRRPGRATRPGSSYRWATI
jgi:hypothetical protein